ncbi:MAG: ribose-phosphate diphosphokinase [Puniceicoccales bacterium]|jgi:ribose-phosphate pyrophosphokinase|nr:ribose-phosphate diphosphokinase [Puniceicoccales bacterium]
MKIFAGSSHPNFANKICDYLRVSLGEATLSKFPNGEIFFQIEEDISGHSIYVVQSMHHPTNDHIMEMLIMIDAIRRAFAKRITAIIPYFGYARQDRKDNPGAPISSKLVANLLVAAGTDRILTMDLHSPQIVGFFDIPTEQLSAVPSMIHAIQKHSNSPMTVCSPDIGGLKMASNYAQALHYPMAIIMKRRFDATHVEAVDAMGPIEGHDILLVDDIIETAETLIAAAKLLKSKGAHSIKACIVHGLITDEGQKKLKHSGIEYLMTSNSVPMQWDLSFPVEQLNICPLFGEAIKRIHNNENANN